MGHICLIVGLAVMIFQAAHAGPCTLLAHRSLFYEFEVFSFSMLHHNRDKHILQIHLCSSESFYGFALTVFLPFLCLLSTAILGNTFSGRNTHQV